MLREDEDFSYSDEMFDSLALYEGKIDENTEEAFKKHYFAGYTNFLKHRKGDHRNYQMNYLHTLSKNFKRVQRNNKIRQEQEQKRLRKEEEKAKKQAAEKEMKKQKAEQKAKKRKEKQDLLRFQKQEEIKKRNNVKQMKKI